MRDQPIGRIHLLRDWPASKYIDSQDAGSADRSQTPLRDWLAGNRRHVLICKMQDQLVKRINPFARLASWQPSQYIDWQGCGTGWSVAFTFLRGWPAGNRRNILIRRMRDQLVGRIHLLRGWLGGNRRNTLIAGCGTR